MVFVPIKRDDYLIVDPEYDYYIYNEDIQDYIPVKNEVIESRPDLDYFILDPKGKKYLPIDRSKVMYPDPKFEYYTYDRNTDLFYKVKNPSKFDEFQQYYISESQDSGGLIQITN
jgi:hypothetical protein